MATLGEAGEEALRGQTTATPTRSTTRKEKAKPRARKPPGKAARKPEKHR
jgi:hypothetical protein